MPKVRSDLALDKMKREYGEFDDIPTMSEGEFSIIDRAKLLIAAILSWAIHGGLKKEIMDDFKLSADDLQYVASWYAYYAMIQSYKQKEVDIWSDLHGIWPTLNRNYLVMHEPETCRRIYRRILVLAQNDLVSPQIRVAITSNTYRWYTGVSPEMCSKSNKVLEKLIAFNEGNIKHAILQMRAIALLGTGIYSLGNMKLAKHYMDRMKTIRIDSEAIDDQKAVCFQTSWSYGIVIRTALWEPDEVRVLFDNFFSMDKRFPNTTSKYPNPSVGSLAKRCMANFAVEAGDWDKAESLLRGQLTGGMENYLIGVSSSHCDVIIFIGAHPVISLYQHKNKIGEDASVYKNAMIAMRSSIEKYAQFIPGTHRCVGAVYVAKITLLLKDRPFAAAFKKLEDALAYAVELDCLPLDVLALQIEIARWKGDAKTLKETCLKCEEVGHKFLSTTNQAVLEKLESGTLKAVDLSFVPEVKEKILSDDEKLAKLQEDLKVAKKEVKTASNSGSEEEIDAARASAKAIKVQIKQLKQEIADKAKPTIDQAKIDEVKAKIADAVARQEKAFDDDDDDAEEAATAEIKSLRIELKELENGGAGTSIPKQKLEDAKKIDGEINKS